MNALVSGITMGLAMALVVSVIGWNWFRSQDTSMINVGQGLLTFARGVLGTISGGIALVGVINAFLVHSPSGYQLYFGWLLSYAVGLWIYFFVRYHICRRDQNLSKVKEHFGEP